MLGIAASPVEVGQVQPGDRAVQEDGRPTVVVPDGVIAPVGVVSPPATSTPPSESSVVAPKATPTGIGPTGDHAPDEGA
jgi:hypothetical protein